MKVADLFEAITANKAFDLFVFGGCGSFATALKAKIGGEIYVIAHNGKDMHAFVKKDGKNYDVKGERSTFQMTRDFSSHWEGWKINGPVDTPPFKKSDSMLKKATEYIEANPKLFKV